MSSDDDDMPDLVEDSSGSEDDYADLQDYLPNPIQPRGHGQQPRNLGGRERGSSNTGRGRGSQGRGSNSRTAVPSSPPDDDDDGPPPLVDDSDSDDSHDNRRTSRRTPQAQPRSQAQPKPVPRTTNPQQQQKQPQPLPTPAPLSAVAPNPQPQQKNGKKAKKVSEVPVEEVKTPPAPKRKFEPIIVPESEKPSFATRIQRRARGIQARQMTSSISKPNIGEWAKVVHEICLWEWKKATSQPSWAKLTTTWINLKEEVALMIRNAQEDADDKLYAMDIEDDDEEDEQGSSGAFSSSSSLMGTISLLQTSVTETAVDGAVGTEALGEKQVESGMKNGTDIGMSLHSIDSVKSPSGREGGMSPTPSSASAHALRVDSNGKGTDDADDTNSAPTCPILQSAFEAAVEGLKKPTVDPTLPQVAEVVEIHLSADTLRWIHKMGVSPLAEMFYGRLRRLASGDRSYCMSKPLKYHPRSGSLLFETKLDRGRRILWTERICNGVPAILIWYVSTHDRVPAHLDLIDDSFRRRVYRVTGQGDVDSRADLQDDSLLIDPKSNNLLKTFYMEPTHESLSRLSCHWEPPMKLTAKELDMVEKDGGGGVLLLGRGGTGKTICLCSRMHRDKALFPNIRQLFVSYTANMANVVQTQLQRMNNISILARSDSDASVSAISSSGGVDKHDTRTPLSDRSTNFMKIDKLEKELWIWLQVQSNGTSGSSGSMSIRQLEESFDARWPMGKKVNFSKFREYYWPKLQVCCASALKGKHLDALSAWTQIRSFLKGSIEAAMEGEQLSEVKYLDEEVMSTNRCKLNTDGRAAMYTLFNLYNSTLRESGEWDEMDLVLDIVRTLKSKYDQATQGRGGSFEPIVDKVYVDEVQDLTQAEIGMLMLMSGMNTSSMFLTGDTAQNIAYGVDFRFEEVRSCVHKLTNKQQKLDRVERLDRNFRSHDGILQVANAVLNILFKTFPKGTDVTMEETGLAQGPRPGFLKDVFDESIVRFCLDNPRLRLLTWDEYVPVLQARLKEVSARMCPEGALHEDDALGGSSMSGGHGGSSIMVYGIRSIKGMEFAEVALVDFFCAARTGEPGPWQALTPEQHKAWKWLLLETGKEPAQIPAEVETQLKVLYTGITRSCSKLIFMETQKSTAGDAFFRFLNEKHDLAKPLLRDEMGVGMEGGGSPVSGSPRSSIMLADDWKTEGVKLAAMVDDTPDVDAAFTLVENAKACFDRASLSSDHELMKKIKSDFMAFKHERALKDAVASNAAWAGAGAGAGAGGLSSQNAAQRKASQDAAKKAVEVVMAYIVAGRFEHAAMICKTWCKEPTLQKLGNRINFLGRK